MSTRKFVVALSFAVGLVSIAVGQTGHTAEMRRIEAYAKSVDARFKRTKTPDLVFADVADYQENKPEWRQFATPAELDKFRDSSETYSVAYNWRRSGAIVRSNFTLFSPSGDWTQYLNHYFRPDGTLAKLRSEMRTFAGNVVLIEELYFDRGGQRIGSKKTYLDLTSNKPKTKSQIAELRETYLDETAFYKTRASLPFTALLGK
jgi:hypothetical protein